MRFLTKKLIIAIAAASLMAVSSPSFAQFDFGKLKDAVNQIQGAVAKQPNGANPGTTSAGPAVQQARSPQISAPAAANGSTAAKNAGTTNFVDAEKIDDSFEGKQVNIEAQVKRNGKTTYVEFGIYSVEGCAAPVKGSKPGTAIRLNGTVTEFSMGGIGQMAAPPSFTLQNCKLADSAGPSASATAAVPHQASGAANTDNPVIETWMKTCMPFTAPTDLEKQIGSGQVTFKGIKVMSAGSADGGSGSVMSLTLAMDATAFRAKFPEFSKKIKLSKSKTCPMGGNRSLAEQSFTGVKGATIECNCLTGGD